MKLFTWWKTPKIHDLFFVNIRKAFLILFPCKHVWELNDDKFTRVCKLCEKNERLVYHRYENIRTEWVEIDTKCLK